jgi:large subunit ribosomal protein L13
MKKEAKTTEDKKIIDANGKTLGRVATEIATVLLGKDKASFQRHMYSGSPVSVINASKIKITNKKLEELYHTRYSGYPGGLRILTGTYTKATKGMKELVSLAVFQMLPDNKIRRTMMKNLQVED